jgi:hypothetical protein
VLKDIPHGTPKGELATEVTPLEDENRILMEERYTAENEGILGSRTTSMSPDGSIHKTIGVPMCDSCGRTLAGERVAVCKCKRKVCPSCAIIHENQVYCRACAKQIVGLTKEDFFVLYGLANDASLKDVKHVSSMSSDTLEEALGTLLDREMIESKGISVFAHYSVTNKGLAALATCEQIFRNEADVIRFLVKLQEFTSGV